MQKKVNLTTSLSKGRTQQGHRVRIMSAKSNATKETSVTSPLVAEGNVRPRPETIPRPERPTKFGKANATRDLAILLSFISLGMLLCTTILKDVGKVSDEVMNEWAATYAVHSSRKKRGRRWPLKRTQTKPKPVAEEARDEIEANVPEESCNLYLAESSLPDGGIGLFSARRYDEGEVVLDPTLMLSLTDTSPSKEGNSLFSLFGMVLKPHPILANVAGGYIGCGDKPCTEMMPPDLGRDRLSAAAFTARRRILPGDEIFTDLSEFPSSFQETFYRFYPKIYRPSAYSVADKIVADEKSGLRGLKRGYERKGRGTVDYKSLLVVKKVVERFDPQAASLLPESSSDLDRIISSGSTSLARLTNRTVNWIVRKGVCFDGVKIGPSSIETAGRGAFATRGFRKGDIVVPAPLLLLSRDRSLPEDVISSAHCFGHDDVPVLFCPLSLASFINHQRAAESLPAPAGGEKDCARGPNASVRWSPWNERNGKAKSLQPDGQLLKTYGVGLSFDIIATRKIEENEEILIDYGADWETKFVEYTNSNKSTPFDLFVPLGDNIFPRTWKVHVTQ